MPEINPRFTYSPERILEVKKVFLEEANPEYLDRVLSKITEDKNFELFENEHEFTVRTNVIEYFFEPNSDVETMHKKARQLVDALDPFTYHDAHSIQDGVFSLDWWGASGATGVVYPQMQRWLNADLFDDTLARDVFDCMIGPYNDEAKLEAINDYRYRKYSNGVEAGANQMSVNVILKDDAFGFVRFVDDPEEPTYERSKVLWRWPMISTIGSCACWGVAGDDRDNIYISDETLRLYEMGPHNVDGYLQSLSLALGMGRLAYEATKYTGTEDIF